MTRGATMTAAEVHGHRGGTTPGAVPITLVVVFLAAAAWAVTAYNRMVAARLSVDTQWAQVEVQYQRRVNLVPALVAAARGSLVQERSVFEAIAQARAAYLAAPAGSPDRVRAASQLEKPLGRLIAVVEASPALRSSETVAALMDELAGTENRIAVERRRYNERVRGYNTLVQQFPGSAIAARTGFRPRPYFEAAAPAAAPPPIGLPSP
ncbi:MAG TPA: LemA family protein [bacterium]|nr:LemA family protein [bacterium]